MKQVQFGEEGPIPYETSNRAAEQPAVFPQRSTIFALPNPEATPDGFGVARSNEVAQKPDGPGYTYVPSFKPEYQRAGGKGSINHS